MTGSVLLERAIGAAVTLVLAGIGLLLAIGRYPIGVYIWLEAGFVLGTIAAGIVFFSRSVRRRLRFAVPLARRLRVETPARAVYDGIPASERGPGVHVMTGPIAVEGARAGDTLEVRILAMRARLPYGTNIGAWWGYLYPEMKKERITIYRLDTASGNAQATFAFDYELTAKYEVPGTIIAPERTKRVPALDGVRVPLRPHFGVMGVAPREAGKVNSIPPGDFGGNVDNWRIGPGATMYYPIQNDGALFFVGDPHAAEGDAELSGTAIESSHDGTLQLIVRKDFPTDAPLREMDTVRALIAAATLSHEEILLVTALEVGDMSLDELSASTRLPIYKVSSTLLILVILHVLHSFEPPHNDGETGTASEQH